MLKETFKKLFSSINAPQFNLNILKLKAVQASDRGDFGQHLLVRVLINLLHWGLVKPVVVVQKEADRLGVT